MGLTNTPFEHSDPNNSQQPGAHSSPMTAAILSCDAVTELMPAYSIGGVDPEELAAINRRLATCPPALAELADYTKLAEGLFYAAPPRQVPPDVANRLRAAIGAPKARPVVSPIQPKLSQYTLLPPPVVRAKRRWSFGRILATTASLVLLAMNITLLVQNQQLRASQERLAAQLAQQNQALVFLAAEEPKEVILPAAQENSTAQADVLWNDNLGVAIIYVRDFPTLPPHMVYQLWLNKEGVRTSGGLFRVDEQGMGIMVFPIEQAIDAYDRMGITPEPAGGSPGPTGEAVVRGPV